jgi:hypothetical protein
MAPFAPMWICPGSSYSLRDGLGTLFFQWISFFPRKNELIFLRKMKIPWENIVLKLVLKGTCNT